MAPKFGTSGLRGLVVELTPDLVADHVRAFVSSCDIGSCLCVGQDLRPSSPRIAGDVIDAALAMGIRVIDCGCLPTPALALAAVAHGGGAVMVTGSHIPADRNGLKFYSRTGEITKDDETGISASLGLASLGQTGTTNTDDAAIARFVQRYVDGFAKDALSGLKIGHYTHSAVGRDMLSAILSTLGAEVVELGRSDHFIPVDTEAVDPATRAQIAAWVAEHGLDALVSMDGDSDRPLLADETGKIVPGDVLGQITAEALGASTVVTPVSSNSGVARKSFKTVTLTRIGSPYVIAGIAEIPGRVVGYEANGGFLLGFDADSAVGRFAPLLTRDCVLPIVTVLAVSAASSVSARVAQEPSVVTLADRLQEVPQDKSQPLVAQMIGSAEARARFLIALQAQEASVDCLDGVRITLTDRRIVHIRPSGNAPELRLYVEADSEPAAETLLKSGLAALRAELDM